VHGHFRDAHFLCVFQGLEQQAVGFFRVSLRQRDERRIKIDRIDVTLVGPPTLLPAEFAGPGVRIERTLDEVLPNVDGVMMLRIQRERAEVGLLPSLEDYTQRFQLNRARLQSLRGDAVILHPRPYNRGVELTDDVLEDPRSRYVAQVANGVFVRMAVLDLLVNGAPVPA